MNVQWMKVMVAAIFEVGWVIGLKHADSLAEWAVTAICIAVSFYLLVMAGKVLPVGTVYAVFVGLGTTGTVLSDIVFFGEPFQTGKMILILVLLAGVVGLKLVTEEKTTKGADS